MNANGLIQLFNGLERNSQRFREMIYISDLLNQEEDIGPHPTPTEKIQSLETVGITETEVKQDLQCSVCLESYKIQESVRKLPCNHLFHSRCVVPWLELNGSCPLCRKTVVEEEKNRYTQ
ncbi:E3 ubiquitin-protein ligase RNF115-like [Artemia franciscana]|uniref:RING-type E3 ubiquitin transferase n=1 Tax=Artemia franciscana TaxID=6661 RepID=A0AA88KT52_ARTSF|nr:hypothetical protein QYM36_019315 [Artemia franciscana]